VGAPALHVGAEDAPLAALRVQLGRAILIGVSCYGSVRQAQEAAAQGADYVAFGSFFASPSKPQAPVISMAVLTAARAVMDLPIVAIGGITEASGGALLAAGADALAVISGIFGANDVEGAARRFTALFGDRKE
ncbi:thiamine phosphate synthase, partial [Acidithiobacillus sp. MC6.1]|nr:thiamine phosphate synthase [Acidithiobacillus sp. MC6.1]